MKEKALKINKKDYNIAKSLSDRDFGTLVRALCEYVYYGIDASPKDKILKVYYEFLLFSELNEADKEYLLYYSCLY